MRRESERGAWGRHLPCLLLLLAMMAGTAPTLRAEEPSGGSIVDYLRERGEDASFAARTRLFGAHFPGEIYRGRADQNLRLLRALRASARANPDRPGPPPRAPAAASGRRTLTESGWQVELDLSGQVLRLHLPEDVVYERPRRGQPAAAVREAPVLPTLPPGSASAFVSAAALALKAKTFDDGLYAAVDLAAQAGHGSFPAKIRLLASMQQRLGAAPPGRAAAVLWAAAEIGGSRVRAPKSLAPYVAAERRAFLQDPLRSKPLAFYTWSPGLSRVFQQDRLLQTPIGEDGPGSLALARALDAAPSNRAGYVRWLRLVEGLTNPWSHPDLRVLEASADSVTVPENLRILPPSRSHEGELAKRLWGQRPVPEGADLMTEVVTRVKAGTLSLAPREDSGWYDHQTWALEPLVRPETTVEAARLDLTAAYRDYLVELFKGALALTRETHVKQLEITPTAEAAMPRPTVHVGPDLALEPLVTHYERRAEAYRFVRDVLEEAFGEGSLGTLRRLRREGPVAVDLDTELRFMEQLFDGAAETARRQLGVTEAEARPGAEEAAQVFDSWRAKIAADPDLGKDARMLVPVLYDLQRRKAKVWAFLGWQEKPLTISYVTPPKVHSLTPLPGTKSQEPEVVFHGQSVRIAVPVMAEVYVSELLDRAAFRAHCDRYKTRSAILRNLR